MVNNDMTRLMADGGGTVDPVSGNEVPPGSLPQEVRDDIDAKLSEGEFVFPADVVRYIGLNKLMEIRDYAKKGLGKMAEQGQMGNADQVEDPDELHGDEFSSQIDSIMAEVGGEKNNLAVGGMPSAAASPANNPIEVKQFKDPQGNSTFITFMDGKAMSAIPQGAQEVSEQKQAEAAAEKLAPTERDRMSGKEALGLMKSLQDPNYFNKKLQEQLMNAAFEAGKPKATETTPESIKTDTPFGDQLDKFSQALDFNLFGDTVDSDLLSADLNAGADLNTDMAAANTDVADAMPTPTDTTVDVNTVPTTTTTTVEPTMFAAKGGLAMAKGGLGLRTHDDVPSRYNPEDNSYSTEVSITVTDPRLNKGRPTNIPSLWGGKEVGEDQAIVNALAHKGPYPSYETIDQAVKAAQGKSASGGADADYAKGGLIKKRKRK